MNKITKAFLVPLCNVLLCITAVVLLFIAAMGVLMILGAIYLLFKCSWIIGLIVCLSVAYGSAVFYCYKTKADF